MRTLTGILISTGQMDRLYDGTLPLHLWRAFHKEQTDGKPLYPDFAARLVRGMIRRPDITIIEIGGVEHVEAEMVKGTSLFDRKGIFGERFFGYFEIPAGTDIPRGLVIIKGDFNDRYQATHYSICPDHRMPKQHFIYLLDQLAANAMAAVKRVK